MSLEDTFRARVLVTKIGLDGHDRGSRIVAAACRDAGMEVIYTPPWQTIAAVVKLALEEDVDVVGISSLATDHLIVPRLMNALRDAGLGHMRVVVGGIVPDNEETLLLKSGVRQVFHPGGTMDEITAKIRDYALEAREAGAQADMGKTPEQAFRIAARFGDAPRPGAAGNALPHRRHRSRNGHVPDDVSPLYGADDWAGYGHPPLGFPGQPDYTRGIYATMHRGKTWTQRQLVGLGTPADYNKRLLGLLERGATAVSLIPCNSVYRGYDGDSVEPELLGTCGVVVNNVEHMDRCLKDVDVGRISCALNDPSPFTLLAFMLVAAERRGIDWKDITGTSNQSDYISHYVANHMFYRLSLPGARRVLMDHIAYCRKFVPRWNPMSVVGQHTQQAARRPRGEGLPSHRVQNSEDASPSAGPRPVPRASLLFDISLSFFEEVAKFRAGRRIWARLARERIGAKNPNAWRFKFHAQTSGVDLTRQQPLNNIARVTAQAMAGIFGGLQSLHTDSYDEVFQVPGEAAARIAVATQNILREEAHLTDVIDPLGGSFYVESLTDAMEEKILVLMKTIDDAGACTGRRVGPGAAHYRRLGVALPAEGRQRRATIVASTPTAPRRGGGAARVRAPDWRDAVPPRRVRHLEGDARGAVNGARRPERAPKTRATLRAVVDGRAPA